MRPKEGYAICPVGPLKGALQTRNVVHVGRDHFRAKAGELLRFIGVGITGEHARGKIAIRIAQDGAS